MIKRIITKNLILRKALSSDLEEIYNNVWKHSDLAKNMLWKVTDNIEDANDRLQRTISYQENNDAFFVTLKSTGEVIGFGGFFQKEDGVYEDTGICICQKEQRKGYAKELVSGLEKLIFEELKGKRFIYSCMSHNEPSKKVCSSLGFKYSNSVPQIREYDNFKYICDYYYLDQKDYNTDDSIVLKED